MKRKFETNVNRSQIAKLNQKLFISISHCINNIVDDLWGRCSKFIGSKCSESDSMKFSNVKVSGLMVAYFLMMGNKFTKPTINTITKITIGDFWMIIVTQNRILVACKVSSLSVAKTLNIVSMHEKLQHTLTVTIRCMHMCIHTATYTMFLYHGLRVAMYLPFWCSLKFCFSTSAYEWHCCIYL